MTGPSETTAQCTLAVAQDAGEVIPTVDYLQTIILARIADHLGALAATKEPTDE